jgi:Putative prokaryotic signal transducing protein
MTDNTEFEGHVEVAEAGQLYQAELIALRLRAHGIDAHVVDQTFHLEPIPNVRSFAVVRVMVPRDQADEARRILAHNDPLPADAEPEGTPEVM